MLSLVRVIFAATLSLFLFQSCFHRAGEITLLSESEPLIVKVDPGTEVIDWVWFQGPHQNVLVNGPKPPPREDPRDVIVWQISPGTDSGDGKFASPDKHPIITYGQVPEGWTQQRPLTGSPERLLDGFVYTVHAVTFRGPRPRGLCVYVNNGRLEPYVDGDDPACKE